MLIFSRLYWLLCFACLWGRFLDRSKGLENLQSRRQIQRRIRRKGWSLRSPRSLLVVRNNLPLLCHERKHQTVVDIRRKVDQWFQLGLRVRQELRYRCFLVDQILVEGHLKFISRTSDDVKLINLTSDPKLTWISAWEAMSATVSSSWKSAAYTSWKASLEAARAPRETARAPRETARATWETARTSWKATRAAWKASETEVTRLLRS